MTPQIEIQGVTKSFGSFQALKGVSFDIDRAEFFSLLGASGCGKTTLLRILAGIEHPTTGRVLIDGQDMNGIPPERRPTNMVFQSYAIFPHLNVEENVGYGLKNLRLSRAETAARIAEALAMVKLEGLARRNAHALSGGQRQRVALARALVMRPKVLLLDEPLSALDKKLREEMQLELRAMQRKLGITFVFVTHDQEEAMTLSDRIAIVSGGRTLQIDTPRRLYEQPVNREVAEFIGTMNLIPAQVIDAATVDAGPLGRLAAPFAESAPRAPGASVHLALRPERLTLGAEGLGGTVTEAVYLGDRITYLVVVPGLEKPLRVVDTNRSGDMHAIGAPVGLAWAPDAGLVLGD
ncbi:ABC transporter ATP-binding protein [Seohaeicola nanhaiensis]|uniref:ABC transporter ATP-binding protein n=1 Tax=Seohaeicola nanhaiensis TaxID=1387282 RepID=A0ABV9KE56_9RHOB